MRNRGTVMQAGSSHHARMRNRGIVTAMLPTNCVSTRGHQESIVMATIAGLSHRSRIELS